MCVFGYFNTIKHFEYTQWNVVPYCFVIFTLSVVTSKLNKKKRILIKNIAHYRDLF